MILRVPISDGSEKLAAKLSELEQQGYEITTQVNAGDGVVISYRKRQGRPAKPLETR